jgi:hypothetical protein
MNRALVVALWRQRLTSPVRLVMLGMFAVPPTLFAVGAHVLAPVLGSGYWLALVLAAGAVGQDVSSGVLHLTFARPVTRAEYVFSRWFGAATGALAVSTLMLVPAVISLAAHGAERPFAEFLAAVVENAVLAATGAAVLTCFSAFADGLGDVAILAVLTFGLQLAFMLSEMKHWDALRAVTGELQQTLRPDLALGWFAGQGSPAFTGLAVALSTTVLALAIAIVRVNRRELSYAAG